MRMIAAWLSNTRPGTQLEISQIAQVAQVRYEFDASEQIKRLNTVIRYAHNNVEHLKFPKIDRSSTRVVGYSDASFSNNCDITSQLGRLLLLIDG